MSSSSDGHLEDINMDTSFQEKTQEKSSKRKLDETEILENIHLLSDEQLQEIIGISKKQNLHKKQDNPIQQKSLPETDNEGFTLVQRKKSQQKEYTGQQKEGPSQDRPQQNVHRNTSKVMKEIANKKYINLFYINTDNAVSTRLQMADIWDSVRPNNTDTILKTKKGYLLKTDSPKLIVTNTLKSLQIHKKITGFSETSPYNGTPRIPNTPVERFSCVIASMEREITDEQISEHLKTLNIEMTYCKRIISRKTDQPTHFIRIITTDSKSYEKLLNEGMFFKSRHYAVYPSAPPPPAPIPCSKCHLFTHTTDECTTPIKCHKCGEQHSTFKCKSDLPPKCNACGSTEHQAWAFQCPKRPTRPIDGIPNLPVKTLNKKSHQIKNTEKKTSRIHSPITIHDVIINTYIEKLNEPTVTNRDEILKQLRQKFIRDYNIETTVSFIRNNWIYILMFDLDLENEYNSPTETIPGKNNSQVLTQI